MYQKAQSAQYHDYEGHVGGRTIKHRNSAVNCVHWIIEFPSHSACLAWLGLTKSTPLPPSRPNLTFWFDLWPAGRSTVVVMSVFRAVAVSQDCIWGCVGQLPRIAVWVTAGQPPSNCFRGVSRGNFLNPYCTSSATAARGGILVLCLGWRESANCLIIAIN